MITLSFEEAQFVYNALTDASSELVAVDETTDHVITTGADVAISQALELLTDLMRAELGARSNAY